MFFSLFGCTPRCQPSQVKCEQLAKNLFLDYCNHFDIVPEHISGVQRFDFFYLENFFKPNRIV